MKKQGRTITDYLSILYTWKKFVIINLITVVLITTGITFLIPEKFKASATIMISQDENMGALNNVLSNVGSLFGGGVFSNSGSSIDKMFGYLESKRILEKVIRKFNLEKYYGYTKYIHDRTLKAFKEDVNFDLTQNGFIEVSMVHESPDTSALIANYIVGLLDSLNRKITLENATSYRRFIEKRYNENLADLANAEAKMKQFQKRYNVFVVPDQFKLSFEAIGKLESELMIKQLKSDLLKDTKGAESPEFKVAKKEVDNFKRKITKLKQGVGVNGDNSLIFLPINELPEIYQKYFQIYREVEVQSKLLEFILPMYEQAKMEEQKNIPTIITIDHAVPPELKYSPKKSFIIISVSILFLFFEILIVIRAHVVLNFRDELNIIQDKEKRFYDKLSKVFGLKIT